MKQTYGYIVVDERGDAFIFGTKPHRDSFVDDDGESYGGWSTKFSYSFPDGIQLPQEYVKKLCGIRLKYSSEPFPVR